MERDRFVHEVEARLSRMLSVSKAGQKVVPVEKYRLEGFMQAGVFLDLVTKAELLELMWNVHMEIFGQTVTE